MVPTRNSLSEPFSKSKSSYGSGIMALTEWTENLVDFAIALASSFQHPFSRRQQPRHLDATGFNPSQRLGLFSQTPFVASVV